MSTTIVFPIILILATLLCALVAGLLFAFAIVIMPGLKTLTDREFIRAFQVIDGVIQNSQPVFMLVWVGSVLAVLAALVLGIGQLTRAERLLLVFSAAIYLLGVQLPTARINVPLNNQLQTLNVDAMNETERAKARAAFEPRWNRWNSIRAAIASLATGLLMILLFRL
jgi:uncharacterized membrane protein